MKDRVAILALQKERRRDRSPICMLLLPLGTIILHKLAKYYIALAIESFSQKNTIVERIVTSDTTTIHSFHSKALKGFSDT